MKKRISNAQRFIERFDRYRIAKAHVTANPISESDYPLLVKLPHSKEIEMYIRARIIVDSFESKLYALEDAEIEFCLRYQANSHVPHWYNDYYSISTYYRMIDRIEMQFRKFSGKPV